MRVPGFSSSSSGLYRRKGGGGKGGGKSGGSGGVSGGKGGSAPISVPGSTTGGKSASAYGSGGGRASTIQSGPYAGRSAGGGTRDQVYGTQTYGSGYAGTNYVGVGSLGFPYYYWPVIWAPGFGYGGAYLYSHNYGHSNNPDRPGGPLVQANFTSPTSNSTFHVLSDNSTVVSLLNSIQLSCTLSPNSTSSPNQILFYNDNDTNPTQPRPEQVVQYYRASSVALTLDGYNNTAALSNNASEPNLPLPQWLDRATLDCLNSTIGAAAPLIDSAGRLDVARASMGTLGLLWILISFAIGW